MLSDKFQALFLTLAFCLWILPLGVFIKPSEEYRTCGGKRAFHQCSMMQGKVRTGPAQVALSSGSGVEKSGAQSSSGDEFVAEKNLKTLISRLSAFRADDILFRSFVPDRSLDIPPRTLPLF